MFVDASAIVAILTCERDTGERAVAHHLADRDL
jgi:uncharacterized protein with PIN domain